MNKILYLIIFLVLSILVACTETTKDDITSNETPKHEKNEDVETVFKPYFPIDEWVVKTPESQGMDSEKLADVFKDLEEWYKVTNSVIIIRNGYIVAEKYYNGYTPETKQWIYSATKSVLSGLIGVAVEEGYLTLDERIIDIFSDREIENIDEYKENITVKDLLTMRSGYQFNPRSSYGRVLEAEDMVQFILDLPMKEEPGMSYNYNSGDSHLLSAIIQEKTEMSTADFAQEYLFNPLNIQNVLFKEMKGVALGANGLAMTPYDMAKIGLLYINDGDWNGEQIIPKEWIKDSITTEIEELFMGGTHYGFQWYIDEIDGYSISYAQGAFGQYILVIPGLDVVVVVTSGNDAPQISRLPNLFEPIVKAAISEKPTKENEEGLKELNALLKPKSTNHTQSIQTAAEIIEKLEDKTYFFEENKLNWERISSDFSNGDDEFVFEISYDDGTRDMLSIGKESYPHLNEIKEGVVSVDGRWEDKYTLVLGVKSLEYLYDYTINFQFLEEDFESVQVTIKQGGQEFSLKGRNQME